MKTCFTLTLFCFSLSLLHAQWESTHGPVGGSIYDLDKNDNYLFAATENGLYRSADGGYNWSQLNVDQTGNHSISKIGVNGSTLIAFGTVQFGAYDRDLFKSDDNGDTWYELNLPDTVSYAEVAVTDYAIYVLVSYTSLLLSIDNGQTWQNSSLGASPDYSEGIATFNQKVYVGGHGKLYRSEPNADVWTVLPIPGMTASVDILHVFDDVIFVRDYQFGDLFVSTDDGQTWQQSPGVTWGNGWTNFVKIGNAYYANHFGNVWKTLDLGASWIEIPTTQYVSFYKMIGHGNDLLVGTINNSGILRSSDLGQSFHPSNQGLDASDVSALAFNNGELLAGCNYIGMYRYDLSQENWDTTIYSPVQSSMTDIAVVADKIFAVSDYGLVSRSDNNGLDWMDITPGGPFGSWSFTWLYVDGNTLYVSGDGDSFYAPLFKSEDFGQSWEEVMLSINGDQYSPMLFAKNSSFIFTSDFLNVFRSADDGQTWEIVNPWLPANHSIKKLVVANDIVFALTANNWDEWHLYASYTNGEQWQLAENGITIEPFYGGVLNLIGVGGVLVATTAGYYDGIFISVDNAQSWLPFNEGLPARGAGELVADGSHLYTALYGHGVWRRSLADLNLQPVTGIVFRDDNNNGIQDGGESPMPSVLIKLAENPSFSVSRSDGNYEILSAFTQPDILSAVPPNPYAIVNPSDYAVSQAATGKNFGVYFPPGIEDLRIELTHYGVARPGFESHYGITYKNMGTTVMDGSVQLTLDAQVQLVSATPAPSQINGNVLTWNFTDLQLLEARSITVNVLVPTIVTIGTELTSTADVNPVANDATPFNNHDTERSTVVGSFDPNDKRVEPGEEMTLEQLADGVPLTYTIRFQNTGTFQADKVRITDQLSQLLDVSTFQFLGSSHPCTFDLRGNGSLEFVFDMINLPDSTSDEAASHGFVKFSVLPRTDLAVGALIQNTAYIYFDFNAPIVTNQVHTKIVMPTGVHDPASPTGHLNIYPNPNAGAFTVLFSSDAADIIELTVLDLQGRTMLQTLAETNSPTHIHLPDVPAGIYFLKGISKRKIFAGRVVIQK